MKKDTLDVEDLNILAAEIQKTGFPLEYRVVSAFERAGWTTINNKYYLDDVHETPKEIDLIAYKNTAVGHLNVFTAIIVSCKKNHEGAWAFLCRKPNLGNPNFDWHPVHISTNDKAIRYQIGKKGANSSYYDSAIGSGLELIFGIPPWQVARS